MSDEKPHKGSHIDVLANILYNDIPGVQDESNDTSHDTAI